MAHNNDTQKDNAWLDGLDEQIVHASPDLLKGSLEQATKLLDHVYAANDAISQKARWAIGVLMGLIGILLKMALDAGKTPIAPHTRCEVWTLYAVLIALLVLSLAAFFRITKVEKHFHSGLEPRKAELKGTIADTHAFALARGATSGTNGLDFAYFIVSTLEEYQRRIDQGRALNAKIAKWFNAGLVLLLIALADWIFTYIWLNA